MLSRRSARNEAVLRGAVDHVEMRILVKVGIKQRENRCDRKGKGSLAMYISQGLVGPNRAPNRSSGKGRPVNIPVLLMYAWQHKFVF